MEERNQVLHESVGRKLQNFVIGRGRYLRERPPFDYDSKPKPLVPFSSPASPITPAISPESSDSDAEDPEPNPDLGIPNSEALLLERNKYVRDYIEDTIKYTEKLSRSVPKPEDSSTISADTWKSTVAFSKAVFQTESEFRGTLPKQLYCNYQVRAEIEKAEITHQGLHRILQLLEGKENDPLLPLDSNVCMKSFNLTVGEVDMSDDAGLKVFEEYMAEMETAFEKLLQQEKQIKDNLKVLRAGPNHPWVVHMKEKVTKGLANLEHALKEKRKLPGVDIPDVAISVFCMDYWKLPRPYFHDAFKVRQNEKQQLDEVNQEIRSCFNPAIFDVRWHRWSKPTYYCDYYWKDLFTMFKNPPYNWKQRVEDLKFSLGKYPCGVELRKFVWDFRSAYKLNKREPVFGCFPDEDGVAKLRDLFYTQKLGEKVILFNALYEGAIVTPKEMFARIWKRIYPLAVNLELPIANLPQAYEKAYGRPFFMQDWGFRDGYKFVQWTLENMPEQIMGNNLAIDIEKKTLKVKDKKIVKDPWAKWAAWKNTEKKEQSTKDNVAVEKMSKDLAARFPLSLWLDEETPPEGGICRFI